MLYYNDVTVYQKALDINWVDWCKGGPRREGYTRVGMVACYKQQLLSFCRRTEMSIEDVLAKNRAETQRWHIDFLKAKLALRSKFNYCDTAYYWEYLKPRYTEKQAEQRANEFIDLLADIAEHGIRNPLWVADFGERKNMRFRYFRFDGCHRVCCAKVCFMNTIPVLLFKAKELRSV